VEVIDTENVTKLVKVALPHQVEYIEKHGPSAFHYLLDELETYLLLAFKLMLKGEESDKDTLEKAASIIKQAETLMDANPTSDKGK
jgi:DNA primase